MIKGYTDLEQSKKLAEILSLKSADMFCADVLDMDRTHSYNFHILSTWGCNTFEELKDRENKFVHFIPCWSLTALIELLPPVYTLKPMIDLEGNSIYYSGHNTLCTNGDTLIDACVNMIFKLNEQNLI